VLIWIKKFIVAAWHAETCRLLFLLFVCSFVGLFVGHAVTEINEVWQHVVSLSERDEIWHVDRSGNYCTLVQRLVNFGPRSSHRHQNSEVSENLCNTFLVHRLAERDEIWQRYRGLANRHLFPKFDDLWSGVGWYHAATCISPLLMYLFKVFNEYNWRGPCKNSIIAIKRYLVPCEI